jgi:AraC-like DNA-binding protein
VRDRSLRRPQARCARRSDDTEVDCSDIASVDPTEARNRPSNNLVIDRPIIQPTGGSLCLVGETLERLSGNDVSPFFRPVPLFRPSPSPVLFAFSFRLPQVAAHAGFSDQSQFCQHFKRLVGVTPGQFRMPARTA